MSNFLSFLRTKSVQMKIPLSVIPPRWRQNAPTTASVPFPSQQLFILGESCSNPSPPAISNKNFLAFTYTYMDNIRPSPTIHEDRAVADFNCVSSGGPNLRTNRFYVHFPIRLLYDSVIRHNFRHSPNCGVCRHGHLSICFCRILVRCCVGTHK